VTLSLFPYYLLLSAVLFTIGVVGVLTRRNVLVVLMSIELMLNAVNPLFISFARYLRVVDGQVIVFFVMVVAAAEVAVGLGIVVARFRLTGAVDADDASLMKW